MNEIQRKVKLFRMADIIGVSPAAVRICGKERLIPWTINKNDHYFYLSIETISDPLPAPVPNPPTPDEIYEFLSEQKHYTASDARLLESQKWILPRFEKITSIRILDAYAKYLLCELYWKVDVTRFLNSRTRKKSLPRTANVTNGVWKIYKNRLPEHILMNTNKNKSLYRRLCNCEYETCSKASKEIRKKKDAFLAKRKK